MRRTLPPGLSQLCPIVPGSQVQVCTDEDITTGGLRRRIKKPQDKINLHLGAKPKGDEDDLHTL
ncbi:hypothetical protein [Leptolyngbya sp. FACHB-711]|uniref:hypothetical protein n=1 Tax=Leptolyngbya sp. FACHB-711 TaxID=2692813 RepID=UPI001688FD03|nr:hypothetical protein [Leptolyngbya sp. FACHB-711]